MQVCCGDVGQVILGKGKSLEVSSSFHRNMRYLCMLWLVSVVLVFSLQYATIVGFKLHVF